MGRESWPNDQRRAWARCSGVWQAGRWSAPWLAALVLLLAACGGAKEATSTPSLTATPRSTTPFPTPAPSATATRAPATTTSQPPAPAPVATPTAAPTGVPQPAVAQGRRGGTLQLRAVSMPAAWDTYDARGRLEFHVLFGPLMNNLIWPDPYRDGHTLVGDLAESWQFSEAGNVVTLRLRRGVLFHDGTPFTSKDVVYNVERGWKPRSATMTVMRARLQTLQGIEAPDDLTVRLTFAAPSNAVLRSLSINEFLMFPAHLPLPDSVAQFRRNPIGTGPYKFKAIVPDANVQLVRNDAYFRPGLPYVDGVVITNMTNETAAAAFRTGRIDASNFDGTILRQIEGELVRAHGWVPVKLTVSLNPLRFSQRPPWVDARIREAVDLALDRQEVVDTWLEGQGSPFAAPLLPPELGGLWGISVEEMKKRPGYRTEKAQDLAMARELLRQAGIDPGRTTVAQIIGTVYPFYGEVVERAFVALGFKTKLEVLAAGPLNERLIRGDFDFELPSSQIQFDDPVDYLAPLVATNGAFNYSQWSNPAVDALLDSQDRTLDQARRKQLLQELQEAVLKDRFIIPVLYRFGPGGSMPWVKNYPRLPFQFSPWYRWEQVWLER